MKFEMLENEYWWCGSVDMGHEMPFSYETDLEVDLNGNGHESDQYAPVMVSSLGRYVWSEESFKAKIKNGMIELVGNADFELHDGYKNLKGAYLAAMEAHFPFTGELPDELFWRVPQYNTWIELGTNQTSENIINYAKAILDNGLPPGVLMIDGGWQEDYGIYEEFNRGKIPDPKALTEELHNMGFKVMLWVSPIVASAGTRFKELRAKGYLIRNAEGETAVRKWWSGYSAVLDFSNPEAVKWMRDCLSALMEKYGIDGFKFDAGDYSFYGDDDMIYKPMPARDQTAEFNRMGEIYKFNEYRAAWKFGGHPIVARLHDKYHSWDEFGLNTLISHTVAQGLCGYAYCCPDMVGGGILDCFTGGKKLDEELFVRWAQANALMGMMQLSRLPWGVLSAENAKRVAEATEFHAKFGDKFYELAQNAAKTGEPIVRHMAYEFPDEHFETENGQFMLGSDILAAPVLEKGAVIKNVRLPVGKWRDASGKIYDGGQTICVDADIDTLPYFERITR